MDFTKFLSMLENKGLYFARADRLGDPFEGSYPEINAKNREKLLAESLINDKKDDPNRVLGPILPTILRNIRRTTMINCWHMNYQESAAMWALYSKTNEAIVIKSTIEKLHLNLNDNYHIGKVNYIDFKTAELPEGNLYTPFLYKRLSYMHENELRAITFIGALNSKPVIAEASIDGLEKPEVYGLWCHVELNDIIEGIFVAPTSPNWFLELVNQITKRYLIDKPVIRSSLDSEPLF